MRSERLAQGREEDLLRCMALQLNLHERCESRRDISQGHRHGSTAFCSHNFAAALK